MGRCQALRPLLIHVHPWQSAYCPGDIYFCPQGRIDQRQTAHFRCCSADRGEAVPGTPAFAAPLLSSFQSLECTPVLSFKGKWIAGQLWSPTL